MSQRGQAVVEYLLISIAIFAVTSLVITAFNEREAFNNLAKGPWAMMRGMIENGVWQPPEQGRAMHPNNSVRHGTVVKR